MSRHHERYLQAIPAYVLGALEASEARELKQHLESDCAECNAEMLRSCRDLEALAECTTPVAPAETTRARLLAEIGSPAAPAGDAGRRWPWRYLAAAALLAALGWSSWAHVGLRARIDALTALGATQAGELTRLAGALDSTRQRLERYVLASRIVATPGLEMVRLAGLEAAPAASARALIDSTEAKAVFYASDLEPAAPGKIFQLWVIVGGKPVSAGLFDVDASGTAALVIETLESPAAIEAWAVTVEPAGGVAQPTGPMVLMGAVV